MYNSAAPYGFNGYRPNGGRMWGMSQGVPQNMSRYAYSAQDNEYNVTPQTMQAPINTRRDAYSYAGFLNNIEPNNSGNHGSVSRNSGGGGSGGGGGASNSSTTAASSSSSASAAAAAAAAAAAGAPITNLIVNYLPQDMGDGELYSLFRSVGPINTCRIMRDYKSGYSYGYAFVEFTNENDCLTAIKTLNGISVRNKRLKVSYARPGGDAIKDTNLYVTNLPHNITDDQLENIFGKFGTIVQKNILRDKLTGKPRGVAFVRYNKREEAQAAIETLQNHILDGSVTPIGVRLAEEHGKAKAAQYMSQVNVATIPPGMSPAYYNTMVHRGRPVKRFPKVHPYQTAQKFI